ncbi:MAG TPA: hypothetical protein VFA68_20280 [Terriglobales bacterium]|nr:hypothetical protein [Terriglobales bacterium]
MGHAIAGIIPWLLAKSVRVRARRGARLPSVARVLSLIIPNICIAAADLDVAVRKPYKQEDNGALGSGTVRRSIRAQGLDCLCRR